MNEPTPSQHLVGDEDVDLGVKSARDVFMPLFLKELAECEPEVRAKAWIGFMSVAVAAMASEVGVDTAGAVCDGVLEGLEESERQNKARQQAPVSGFLKSLLDKAR